MSLRQRAVEIFRQAVAEADPVRVCRTALFHVHGQRVRVLAAGKASLPMVRGADFGERTVGGIAVSPVPGEAPPGIEVMVAAHPVPDQRSERAGRALLAAAAEPGVDEIVFLISGGASSLVAVPAPGLELGDKREALAALYAAGAPIAELNCARKHLSAIKGGRLAEVASAPVHTIALSDVPGDDPSVIGSGPTVPDPTTFADAAEIFERYVGLANLPAVVTAHLEDGVSGRIADTPSQARPRDRRAVYGGLHSMMQTAAHQARLAGFEVIEIDEPVVGDVAAVAGRLVGHGTRGESAVGCGEATIVLPGDPGRGGRAQHIALLVARDIAGLEGVVVLVAGTDGIDGNSDAAGAVVDGASWAAIQAAGLDPELALRRGDSGTALSAIGATIVTGPTGVNHADLMLVLCDRG